MSDVIITPNAKRSLRTILQFIAHDNVDRAISFIDELKNVCDTLSELPSRGTSKPSLGKNVRQIVHGNYLIFYIHQKSVDQVLILRICEHHLDTSRIKFED